jgi:hypothetical protein
MTPPAAAAQAGAGARVGTRPRRAPGARPPRRVSGPARRPAPARPARPLIERPGGLLLGVLSALERLASHRLLDRLIRGRWWLVIVTFALIGIVTLQLMLLKLNGAVGRALHSEALLQRQNAALSIENSELAAGDRIQAGATKLGMTFASSASLRFLAPSHADFAHGASALSSPLHAPAAGSEQAASSVQSSAGEGTGSERGAGETRSREPQQSEARPGEATGSSAASAEGEGSTRSSRSAAGSEAPSATPPGEGSSAGEPTASGGTQASPAG